MESGEPKGEIIVRDHHLITTLLVFMGGFRLQVLWKTVPLHQK